MGLQQNDLAFNPGQVLPPKVNGAPFVNLCSLVSLFDNTSFSVLAKQVKSVSQVCKHQNTRLCQKHQEFPSDLPSMYNPGRMLLNLIL